ncbi:MAG: TolC family protein [Planctomycetaceae bacterium]
MLLRFSRRYAAGISTAVMGSLLFSGCSVPGKVIPPGPHDTRTSYHDTVGLQIEYPQVAQCMTEPSVAARTALAPLSAEDPSKIPALEMTLPDAIQMAMRQSPVIRNLGGSVVTQPDGVQTVYDPSLVHSDPFFGVEAALAQFDAQWGSQLFWQKIDQPNNIVTGGLGGLFTPNISQGTTGNFQAGVSKQTAQGASFALRNVTIYDNNNRPFRIFTSDFTGWVEAEWRQPLMQGAGTTYNRIAGPNSGIGQYNGVLIARVNEDVALADFETSVIQLVNDVEQAYWDLSTAYRVLEAQLKGRESALQTFQYQEVRLRVGAGRSDEEAQAQSQYYQFQAQVENALSGPRGLYALEQQLRYLLGMPPADGRLIRPITPPSDVRVVFDWNSALGQSLERRVEIRRQRYNVKRREMELIAARLNRRPQLDFLGTYRVRGLGDHLIGDRDNGTFDNLAAEITGGDYQEWRAGMELNFPVGLRAASAAVANARLNLSRERAVLDETELRISHDLAESARQITLTHGLLETNYNGFLSDLRQVDVLRRRYRDGTDNINFLLQAQRQVVSSESNFYRSLADYNLAIRDFHRQKGTLLAYNDVSMTEGPWAAGAYRDAYEVGRFLSERPHPSEVYMPRPLTSGPFDPSAPQDTTPGGAVMTEELIEAPIGLEPTMIESVVAP